MKAESWVISKLIDSKSQALAEYIKKIDNISWNEAVDKMIRTKTYACLVDEKTGLVLESNPYIFNQYELELSDNFEEWIKT